MTASAAAEPFPSPPVGGTLELRGDGSVPPEVREVAMKAAVGDRVFVASGRPGHERMGHVVGLRHPDGTPPYVVRWDDTGAEEVSFLRHDGRIEPQAAPTEPMPAPEGPRLRTWSVDIEVVEDGVDTFARAVLHEGEVTTVVTAGGRATRSPGDDDVPEIGDEIAVARALDQLAGTLKAAAARSLAAMHDPQTDLLDVRTSSGPDLRTTVRRPSGS